jgi:hypothetical protein
MKELPPPWGAYARLQKRLARTNRVDQAWGLEAALNCLLAPRGAVRSDVDSARVARSASRKERYRARLRRIHLVGRDCTPPPEGCIDARRDLQTAESALPRPDWILLRSLAEGHNYDELAAASRVSPGALRVRVLRLRRVVRPLLATLVVSPRAG